MAVTPAGIVMRTGTAGPGAVAFAPASRSNRSAGVRNSRLAAARSITSPVDRTMATTAVSLVNACVAGVFGAGTVKRLCRSNMSDAVPVRAGSVIAMLSAGVVAMITSQNRRRVFTPAPRSDAHTAGCGRVTWRGLAGLRCPAASVASGASPANPHAATAATIMAIARTSHLPARRRRRGFGGAAAMDELEELGARPRILVEHTTHRARDRDRILLLDAAHGHAQMGRLDDDRDAERLELLHQRLGDLRREPLLHLQPAREDVDDAGDLAQPDDLAVRNVGHVAFAEERQQVMLAEAVHVDVAHHHHFIVGNVEERAVDDFVHVRAVPARQKAERLLDATRRLGEALAVGVLTKRGEQLADKIGHGSVLVESFAGLPAELAGQ